MGEEYRRWEARPLIRLHLVVEGQTEESFVNGMLAAVLAERDIVVDCHRITTGRRHGQVYRGGLVKYEHLARDLVLWMKQDQAPESWFSTLIDLYRFPQDFPALPDLHPGLAGTVRADWLQVRLAADIAHRLGGLPIAQRLLPHIQVHEFEALLFADPAAFAEAFPERPDALAALQAIRSGFPCPEDIDHDQPPSERILALLPDYRKPVAGLLIAQRIGIETMRQHCPRFDLWLAQLLGLGSPPG
jgi:hypothetical protein